jgi:hypothetical protein
MQTLIPQISAKILNHFEEVLYIVSRFNFIQNNDISFFTFPFSIFEPTLLNIIEIKKEMIELEKKLSVLL